MPLSPLIEQAIELAAQWHEGTYRKGSWRSPAFLSPDGTPSPIPAFAHVAAVASILQRSGWDEITVAAAFLHDTLEDPDRHGRRLPPERLRELVGEDVASLVGHVTEQKDTDDGRPRPWRARKDDYIAHLKTAPAEAVAISLADKLHNLWSICSALEAGIDVFTTSATRTGLSAGPQEQRWYHSAVLAAARSQNDPRLVSLREGLEAEITRFERLTGRPPSAQA